MAALKINLVRLDDGNEVLRIRSLDVEKVDLVGKRIIPYRRVRQHTLAAAIAEIDPGKEFAYRQPLLDRFAGESALQIIDQHIARLPIFGAMRMRDAGKKARQAHHAGDFGEFVGMVFVSKMFHASPLVSTA